MRILLDTHYFIWWVFGSKNLPKADLSLISDPLNEVFVSAASILEISIKTRSGKFAQGQKILEKLKEIMAKGRFEKLPIEFEHSVKAGLMDIDHGDPFDRLLMAQAETENLHFLTSDKIILKYLTPIKI